MKYTVFLLLFLMFNSSATQAQNCNSMEHSINIHDSWESCQTATNPNPVRSNGHWVLYDFGYVYSIGGTHFWNYNVAGQTSKGMKNITIDYSIDGTNWTQASTFQLTQAAGNNAYVGEVGPHLNEIDAQYILISGVDNWGNTSCSGLSEVRFDIQGTVNTPGKMVRAKVLLEGAYTTVGQMNTQLISNNVLPNAQPFNRSPWNYAGSENVSIFPNNITDWVLVEVRDFANSGTVLEQRAAFVDVNGNLVDTDGTNGVTFFNLADNTDYYLIVRSRNHVALASANALVLPQTSNYDFTNPSNVLGSNQVKPTIDGYFTMTVGDLNSDGVISVTDFNNYLLDLSTIGQYKDGDLNGDGSVTVADFNLYRANASVIGISLIRY